MWFIADLFERYTSNVARTFMKLAAREAEASQRALDDLRARRKRQLVRHEEPGLHLPAPMVHPHTGEALTAESAKRGAVHLPDAAAGAGGERAADPGEHLRARVRAALADLPMGVRGEVIVRYVDELTGATSPEETAALIEKLRKDKKVRVAELRIIVSAVLDQEPAVRKKADHVAVLRRAMLPPHGHPLLGGAYAEAACAAE